MEGAEINFMGKTLKFRDEEDLWLMNRKVSINQVVVEVNYVCGGARGSVRITEWVPRAPSQHTTPIPAPASHFRHR